jgi:hypothetical protein
MVLASAIRTPGRGRFWAFLMVENSTFLGNQEGILTGPESGETITISNSKFENNGNPDPAVVQHALYVGHAGSLTVSNSLFRGQLIGHDIKSRALATTVTNSQIYNGKADPGVCDAGSSSFGIDLPNSGVATSREISFSKEPQATTQTS